MSLVKKIKAIKHHEDFFPGLIGLFTNPFWLARRALANNMAALANSLEGDLLDVGCGRKPYRRLFKVNSDLGLDIENPGHSHENEDVDVFYDGKTFPFADNSFDSMLCNQVLEHVFNPEEFLTEIHRCLKPGGQFLLTVPFVWDEHEQPYDFARYSSFGLRHLFEKSGFEIIEQRKSVQNIGVVFQLLIAYLYKITKTPWFVVNVLLTTVLMLPLTLLGTILGWLLPKNRDLYLDNLILARKI
jgi:SAM-dependent methyltransferase